MWNCAGMTYKVVAGQPTSDGAMFRCPTPRLRRGRETRTPLSLERFTTGSLAGEGLGVSPALRPAKRVLLAWPYWSTIPLRGFR